MVEDLEEPYQVYVSGSNPDWEVVDEEPQPQIDPLQAQIQAIQDDPHFSQWKKNQAIEELIRRTRKESEGKRYW